MNIKIIPYQEKYKQDIINLVLDTYENQLWFVGYERPDIYDIPWFFLNEDYNNFWLAVKDDELIGTVWLIAKDQELTYLKRMIVKKEYRGIGLGKKLLNISLDFAREKWFKLVYAWTVEENPSAIAFYQSQGFVWSDEVPEGITAAKDSVCLKLGL